MTVYSKHSFRLKGRYYKDTSSSKKTNQSSSRHQQQQSRRGPTNIQWSLGRSSSSSSSSSSRQNPSRNDPQNSSSSYQQNNAGPGHGEVTGKNNWKAIPKPSRSGTVNVGTVSQRAESLNFPRGQQASLPQPSSSGIINIPNAAQRGPRFRGGYSRRWTTTSLPVYSIQQ